MKVPDSSSADSPARPVRLRREFWLSWRRERLWAKAGALKEAAESIEHH